MAYQVKEIFYTLQGEGINAGKPAVFCRFSGCNLWSGREKDRLNAVCKFCDTDFVGIDGTFGGKYLSANLLAQKIDESWPAPDVGRRFVVLTGGEPLLQVDEALIRELHDRRFIVAVETNGTIAAPAGLDWICVSPKAGTPIIQRVGNELKVVMPQIGIDLSAFEDWEFEHFLVQPMANQAKKANTDWAAEWCMKNPKWRLSVQTHKVIGIR